MLPSATLYSEPDPNPVREEHSGRTGEEPLLADRSEGESVMSEPGLEQLAGIAKDARKRGYRESKDRY